jgi:GxxExxY protein
VYHEALCREFARAQLPFQSEVPISINYKGELLSTTYRADLVCFGDVLVELKAIPAVGRIEKAQILNYLKASSLTRGLLLNFGGPSLEYKRFIHSSNGERPTQLSG